MINHPNRSRSHKVAVSAAPAYDHERDYKTFRASVQATFDANKSPLFLTDADTLYETYLNALSSDRQTHTCTACRRFIEAFGGLVRITGDGMTTSAVWPADAPAFYQPVIKALRAKVHKAKIVSPFLTSQETLGFPITGDWEHFAVCDAPVFRHALLTPGQVMAAKREDFGTVARALEDFTSAALSEALRVLEADAVHRSERFIGPVKWLIDLQTARSSTKDSRIRNNVLWLAIATAPDGYCHPRASVVGTLLEDILAGLPFEDVRRRFNAKMHPLMYQRPQALPSAGSIAVAEKIVEQMGIAPALERRFARLDELETIWLPASRSTIEHTKIGVFRHLKAKDAPNAPSALNIPPPPITWEKFARTVMPNAKAMDLMVPLHGAFIGMTSAVNLDAPPILKWDRADRRNPIAWYCYHGGSPASAWGITEGWQKISGVTPLPTMWGDQPQEYLAEGVVLVIDGAVDQLNPSLCLFPECIRTELYAVRSVIEAHSHSGRLSGKEKASACGYDIRKGSRPNVTVRALIEAGWVSFTIDRWD